VSVALHENMINLIIKNITIEGTTSKTYSKGVVSFLKNSNKNIATINGNVNAIISIKF
jgi:hypothetical protein